MRPADINTLQIMKGDQGASSAPDSGGKQEVERAGEVAQVSMSAAGHKLQQVTTLAERGEELRAEKVRRLKEQVEQGTSHVEAADVATGIVRSEIARLLGKRCSARGPTKERREMRL